MSGPIAFNIKTSGRIVYLFWALLAGACGSLILYAHVSTNRSDRTWLEYVFVLLIISLCFFAAVTCLLKTFQSNPRIEVSETGFTYYGLLETRRILWGDVIFVLRSIHEHGNFEWLKVKVRLDLNKTRTFKLDFTGLNPGYKEFLKYVRSIAPSANLGLLQREADLAHPPTVAIKRNPEFEKLRLKTRQLSEAEERDELLAKLDQLEASEQSFQTLRTEVLDFAARQKRNRVLGILMFLGLAIFLGGYILQIVASGEYEYANHKVVRLSTDPELFWIKLFYPILGFLFCVAGAATMALTNPFIKKGGRER